MLYTDGSVKKSFKKCGLNEGENLIHYALCKSKKRKKLIYGMTDSGRFMVIPFKVFGSPELLEEFRPSDVSRLEIGIKTGLAPTWIVKINYLGMEEYLEFSNGDPMPIVNEILKNNSSAYPDYLKGKSYLGAVGVKKNKLMIFTKEKLLFLDTSKNNFTLEEEISYKDISAYDVYKMGPGLYLKMYLEIKGKPKLFEIIGKPIPETLEAITNNKTELFKPILNLFIDILSETDIPKKEPYYMEEGEKEVTTFNTKKGVLSLPTKNNKFRVATNSLYFLHVNEDGKLVLDEGVKIKDLDSLKVDSLMSRLKTGGGGTHEIDLYTKDGKKLQIYLFESQIVDANKALEYIYSRLKKESM